jgi:hypothetical protein
MQQMKGAVAMVQHHRDPKVMDVMGNPLPGLAV